MIPAGSRDRIELVVAATARGRSASPPPAADGWATTGPESENVTTDEWWSRVAGLTHRFEDAAGRAGRDPATLRRYLNLDSAPVLSVSSPDAFADAAGRAAELGFTDAVIHWPRPSGVYGGDDRVLDAIAGTLTGGAWTGGRRPARPLPAVWENGSRHVATGRSRGPPTLDRGGVRPRCPLLRVRRTPWTGAAPRRCTCSSRTCSARRSNAGCGNRTRRSRRRNELNRMYGISRMTARQVLAQLVNEELLFRVQGKGTFVAHRKIGTRSPATWVCASSWSGWGTRPRPGCCPAR